MSNVIPFDRNRKPAGIPSGGQFAATSHAAPTVSLGRHAAPIRDIPESLLMGHIQEERLEFELRHCVEFAKESPHPEYQLQDFIGHLKNLPADQSEEFFLTAMDAQSDGADYSLVLRAAAEADTAAHPGGSIAEGYKPGETFSSDGYRPGSLSTGEKFNGYRSATDIAKDIRTELKAATAANYLPKGLKFSVTSDKFSGGQSIRLVAQGVSDADRLDPEEADHYGDPVERPEAKELRRRLDGILSSYNREDIDGQSDYFHVNFYGRAEIENDWSRDYREKEAARRKASRAS